MRHTIAAATGALFLLSACSTPPHTSGTTSEKIVEPIVEPIMCHLYPPPVKLPEQPTVDWVNFEFDSYSIAQPDMPTVKGHADHIQSFERQILIQGNTDERGGAEYNLALGQKRAEAVRKALGVADKRMEAVSMGKEKPKDEGHNEAAWAMNRRADIIYKVNN